MKLPKRPKDETQLRSKISIYNSKIKQWEIVIWPVAGGETNGAVAADYPVTKGRMR